jgi:hypothetical protein
VFKRLSFGLDGGRTPGTSTAVAYGLILNYLDRSVDNRILPSILKAELLRGSSWDTRHYPQTALLHEHLLRRCHLGPGPLDRLPARLLSRLLGRVPGRWGKGVVRRLKRFWKKDPWKSGVIVRSTFGGYGSAGVWELALKEIDANRPLMVTSTFERLRAKGEFCRTVAVCGYRLTAFGQHELLVHSGKYGDFARGSRARLLYIPVNSVLCSYCFDVALLPSALSISPAARRRSRRR